MTNLIEEEDEDEDMTYAVHENEELGQTYETETVQ